MGQTNNALDCCPLLPDRLYGIASGRIDRRGARCFRSEHDTHASARFSSEVAPPAACGMTWSMWNVAS
jgi:hypothetical protein